MTDDQREKNPRALAREDGSAASGAPGGPRRPCAAAGCGEPARRRYCAVHAAAERQRRYRERKQEREESLIDAIEVRLTFACSDPETFRPRVTSFDVADCFADDRVRFMQMYPKKRRHTPIPRIDRDSA